MLLRCPDCGFALALLARRAKYKCARCGKLFPQKKLDAAAFRAWNQAERAKTKADVERQRQLRLRRRPKGRLSKQERQRRLREYRDAYYERHRLDILADKRAYRQRCPEQERAYRRRYRAHKRAQTRRLGRLAFWRTRQAKLAQTASIAEIRF